MIANEWISFNDRYNDYSYVDKEAYSIQEKIQSMIDNYREACKHEYGEVKKNDCTVQCVKCEVWF